MKHLLLIFFIFHFSFLISFAQQTTNMKAMFLSATDSILPLMTKVNKLDCVDFIENNMEAKVKDKFQNPIVLEALTDDYLRLKTSDMSTTEWKLVSGKDLSEAHDNDSTWYIVMINTCSAPAPDSNVMLYTTNWKKVRNIERPDINEFFNSDCNMQSDSILTLKAEIETLPLMTATSSPNDEAITWTIETQELTAETKKTAANCLHPIKCNVR